CVGGAAAAAARAQRAGRGECGDENRNTHVWVPRSSWKKLQFNHPLHRPWRREGWWRTTFKWRSRARVSRPSPTHSRPSSTPSDSEHVANFEYSGPKIGENLL